MCVCVCEIRTRGHEEIMPKAHDLSLGQSPHLRLWQRKLFDFSVHGKQHEHNMFILNAEKID